MIRTAPFNNAFRRSLRRNVHILLLIAITCLVYSNTLHNDYHLDSIYRVRDNTEIQHFWPPWRFFTDARTGSTLVQIAEYRPMMPLSHAINIQIARKIGISDRAGHHAGNIAIHAGSTILLYLLFVLLIRNWGRLPESAAPDEQATQVAFAAALLFAVHPISGSAVNYLAARDLLLMVFFLLASLLAYVSMRKHGDSVHGWFSALMLLSLAILSKQTAIVAFGLIFLFEWILQRGRLLDWRLWTRTLLFAVPTAAYFLLRWAWIAKQNPDATLRLPATIEFPLTMAKAHVFYYLKNFFWPFEMRALAKFDLVQSVLEPAVIVGLIVIASSIGIAWLLRKRNPLVTFAILAYWLLFALEASIFPYRFIVTDYRQYLPFTFLCLLVCLGLFSLRREWQTRALLVGIVLYFSAASYLINRHWKTEESFWAQSVKYGADALAHSNYALAISVKNPQLAEQHFLEALRQSPMHIYASINLGLMYVRQNRAQEGLALLQRMVDLNPKWALAHYWYAKGLDAVKRKAEATTHFRMAADLDPRQLQYQYETALALQSAGEMAASITYLERLMKFNPDFGQSGFLLGFAYQKVGQNRRAIVEYERFLKSQPKHFQAHFNLAYAQMNEHQCQAAIGHFETVLSLRPQYRETHLHLGKCYKVLGNEVQAAEHQRLYERPD